MDATTLTHRRNRLTRWIVGAVAVGMLLGSVAQASGAAYNPELAISDANMRDFDSMSVGETQAFLDAKAGPLGALVTTDHAGKTASAAKIIGDAAREWRINPKVLLVTLQKEQSLIDAAKTGNSLKYRLDTAMGAGAYGGKNRYPGFGNQVYNAARLLNNYGESTFIRVPGDYRTVTDSQSHLKIRVYPENVATWKLYVYTPYTSGPRTTNSLYTKYFGSPFANPTMQRVFSFRNKHNGTYLYTTSVTQRYHLSAKHTSTWTYKGASFSADTSVAKASTVPVYRFYNKKTGKYSFIRSHSTYHARRTKAGRRTWSYSGVAFRASGKKTAGSVTVYRLHNKRTGAYLLTQYKSTVTKLLKTKALRRTWGYEGVAFYLPRSVTP